MGFDLWRTLGITWQIGVGVMAAGAMAASVAALVLSKRRAATAASGLRLDRGD
jgi:hypothetical protein